MSFKEVYTTARLKSGDTTGKEKDKIEVSEENYALWTLIEHLINKISRLKF